MDDGLSNWEMGVSAADRDHPDEARTMATTPARTAGDKWSHAWMTDLSSGFSGRPWAAGCGGTAIGITPLVQHLVQPPRSLGVSALLSTLRTRAPQQNPWVKRGLESDPSTGVKRAPVG